MDYKKRLEEILKEKRMSHGIDNPGNFLQGVYNLAKDYIKPDFQIIECGSYEGATAELFMLMLLKDPNSNLNINPHLTCIDPWGSGEFFGQETLEDLDRAEKVFDKRMEPYFGSCFKKLKAKSVIAAESVPLQSIDLLYLDGDHRYWNVIAESGIWMPKIKMGGYIAGHDWCDHIVTALTKVLGDPITIYEDGSWIYKREI